jgi:hypothetical protein
MDDLARNASSLFATPQSNSGLILCRKRLMQPNLRTIDDIGLVG